jgi:hypothetical protein
MGQSMKFVNRSALGRWRIRFAPIHLPILLASVLLSGVGRAEPVQLAGKIIELPLPTGMCALSEQRHKEQIDFARQLNPERNKLLLLVVPCDRLALYEPNSDVAANTSLLFDTAQWDVLSGNTGEPLKTSNDPTQTIVALRTGLQEVLQALNAARAKGQRYPATGPELRNATIVGEQHDRIFTTSINRFQRPFERGPIDRYAASGFVVIVPYVFKFSIFSYARSETELLGLVEQQIDALQKLK